MESQILEYRRVLNKNRQIFLFNFKEEFIAFDQTNNLFGDIVKVVTTTKAHNGHTYISLLPFLMIMQRQAMNAFEAMNVYQSYQSWILMRPSLEAALMMGKWIDDPENSKIWENREKDLKTYKKKYQGKALISKSLPDSKQIRNVLTIINNDFMHTNNRYYFRHTRISRVDEKTFQHVLHCTDEEVDHKAHLYAFLHLTGFLAQSVAKMFAAQFGDREELKYLNCLQDHFKNRVLCFAEGSPEHIPVLTELGLWPKQIFSKK